MENIYIQDILTQEEELKNVISYCKTEDVKKAFQSLAERNIKKVIFSGMGSSHFCAYGASISLQQLGISSQVISTGEMIYYEHECIDEHTAVCLISQSGESAETKHLIETLDDNVYVVALTNQKESTLAKRGNVCFLLNVSDEVSVTTRTYLSSLILVRLIAAAIGKEDVDAVLREYEKTVSYIGDYLTGYEEKMVQLAAFCKDMKYISLIGRGYSMSSVRAGALFFREVLKFPALDFDSAEFRHGPMEMVQDDFYGIVFAPKGKTQNLSVQMALDIAVKGGKVILITDEEGCGEKVADNNNIFTVSLPLVEEYANPVLQILPVQLLANQLTVEKGIPVGVFRWGSKIMGIE